MFKILIKNHILKISINTVRSRFSQQGKTAESESAPKNKVNLSLMGNIFNINILKKSDYLYK